MGKKLDISNKEEREIVCATLSGVVLYGGNYYKRLLTVGKKYTLCAIYIRSWNTYVELKEFPDKLFNSDLFEEI